MGERCMVARKRCLLLKRLVLPQRSSGLAALQTRREKMNRYRGPVSVSSAKATASTLCQKCRKRDKLPLPQTLYLASTNISIRHYSYECKVSLQDRPYVSRPSRTQQLLNPKLQPKLTSDVPNDLLRKKGVADEQLAKKAEERGRKRDREESNSPPPMSRKRSRSVSSYSSVSTISTTLSMTPPSRRSIHKDEYFHLSQRSPPPVPVRSSARKRQRSISSSMSYSSFSSYEDRRPASEGPNRNTRRKHGSSSPGERGRRRSRSRSVERNRTSNRHDRSRSVQLSRVARNRRSLTPEGPRGDFQRNGTRRDQKMRDRSPFQDNWRLRADHRDNDRYGSSSHRVDENRMQRDTKRAHVPRDRSLSPFSKRLALTQALNMGR
ncbi:hypothetical protein FGG08_002044 [Glutinoglossum americanum]|uniref:Uncharacterized protein n=1 Tax=Glutinoglossum americanum TaxID=1670608 RepID=A0A9P8IAB3_9PEZI|nr:hypothetical protein FGG08_002044 [Glutinoglossum americanum]